MHTGLPQISLGVYLTITSVLAAVTVYVMYLCFDYTRFFWISTAFYVVCVIGTDCATIRHDPVRQEKGR